MKELIKNKSIVYSVVVLLAVIVISITTTIAFFKTSMSGTASNVTVTSGKIGNVEFSADSITSDTGILPGWDSGAKTLTVSVDDTDYDIPFECSLNVSSNGITDLYFFVSDTTTFSGTGTKVVAGSMDIISGTLTSSTLSATKYYKLVFKETGEDQSTQQGKNLNATVSCSIDGVNQLYYSNGMTGVRAFAYDSSGDPVTVTVNTPTNSASLKSAITTNASTLGLTSDQAAGAKVIGLDVSGSGSRTVRVAVSDIATTGETVAVLHYDTTDSEWEKVGNYVVDSNGEITVTTSNFSPFAFANKGVIRTLKVAMLQDNSTIQNVTSDDIFGSAARTSQNGLWSESRSGKTEGGKTVYFYRGAVQNNWVYFAGFYWRIIRTNEDDSVRLLYSGTTHDTKKGFLNEKKYAFNISYDNAKYVGYMYSTSIENSLEANRTDQTAPSTAASTINSWYKTNIVDNNYSSYINADAVYCVDRNAYDSPGNTYTGDWSSSTDYYFGAFDRSYWQEIPTYVCSNASDKFTSTSSSVGVKNLTYPVALMTADELSYAGGYASSYSSNYPWYYTNSVTCTDGTVCSMVGSSYWWLLSPAMWYATNSYSSVFIVSGSRSSAFLNTNRVYDTNGLRPALSIKSCVIATGHGTPTDPYILSNSSC